MISLSTNCASIPNCDEVVEISGSLLIESDETIAKSYFSTNIMRSLDYAEAQVAEVSRHYAFKSLGCATVTVLPMDDGRQCAAIILSEYETIVQSQMTLQGVDDDSLDEIHGLCQLAVYRYGYDVQIIWDHAASYVNLGTLIKELSEKYDIPCETLMDKFGVNIVDMVDHGISDEDIENAIVSTIENTM